MEKNQKIVVGILAVLAIAVASFIYILSTTEPTDPIVLEKKVQPKPAVVAEVTTDETDKEEDTTEEVVVEVLENEKTTTETTTAPQTETTSTVETVSYEYEAVTKEVIEATPLINVQMKEAVTLENFSFEETDKPYEYRLLFKEDGVITYIYDHLLAPFDVQKMNPSLTLTDTQNIVASTWFYGDAGAAVQQQVLVNYRTKEALRFNSVAHMSGNVYVRIDHNDSHATFHLDRQDFCNEDTAGQVYRTAGLIHEETESTVPFSTKYLTCASMSGYPVSSPSPEITFQSMTADFSTVYFSIAGVSYENNVRTVAWTEHFAYDTASQTLTAVDTAPHNVVIYQ